MKIFYVTNLRLPNERGVSFGVVTMCKALSQAGNEVELIAPNQDQPSTMKGETIWHYHQIDPKTFTLTKLSFWDISVPHLHNLALNWSFGLKVIIYLLKKKAEVVHLFNDTREILFLLKLISWFYHPFVIFELHILPIGRYEKIIEDLAIKRVDLLLVTTNRFAKYYQDHNFEKGKILVFPNGIDLSEFDYGTSKKKLRSELNLPQDAFIVGYAGRFVTMGMEKGIPELIIAGKSLKARFPNIQLVCVGGPEEYVARYKQLDEGAIFIGNVPRKTLYKYMRAFDVCAMPFPWTEHFAYNMSPLKMFEYMASKNPIIATKLPSFGEILADHKNALLSKPGSWKSIAWNIEELIRDKRLCNKLSGAAFTEVTQKYTWEKRADSEVARIIL
ncbi:MAG: glycosyltransferase family 4 protein [Patescibacteria group bacterium]|nr:glycosyltransferase family 4 protein [Patescibacteria group bacterium]MCL5431583.1 glycosyltransferase family 4 protein [Patescibacteria group bacterium]